MQINLDGGDHERYDGGELQEAANRHHRPYNNNDCGACNNNFPIRFPIHDEQRHGYALRYMMKEIKEQQQQQQQKIDAASTAADANRGSGANSDGDKLAILSSIRCVPRGVFAVDPDSYTPWVLSMGPLYSSMLPVPCLMDRCKALCMSSFMSRHGIDIASDVSQLVNYLLPDATRTFWSHLYPDLLTFDNDRLRLSFTIDTVFLHEFLLFLIIRSTQPQHDSKIAYLHTFLSCSVRVNEILRDLALVGNQIPMQFLTRIAELKFSADGGSGKPDIGTDDLDYILEQFAHHACIFYNSQYSETTSEDEELQGLMKWANIPRDTFRKRQHLLDCIYLSCTIGQQSGVSGITSGGLESTPNDAHRPVEMVGQQSGVLSGITSGGLESTPDDAHRHVDIFGPCWPPKLVGRRRSRNIKPARPTKYRLPTASRLSKAGIRFKACNGNVSAIKYEKRKLELVLPRLVVYNTTDAMLRNLLAHEQSRDEGVKLTMYAVLMDSLIDTTEDLAILTDAKVLTNHLGSDERLVKMWNDMCVNVVLQPSMEFIQMSNAIWEHYETPWRRWEVEFRSAYFSRPWYWIPIFVGFLLLLCSTLQTTYSILSYINKQ